MFPGDGIGDRGGNDAVSLPTMFFSRSESVHPGSGTRVVVGPVAPAVVLGSFPVVVRGVEVTGYRLMHYRRLKPGERDGTAGR